MARKKKVVLEPAGKDLKQFQAKYATVWKSIVDSPAYQAGIQFLRNKKLNEVSLLSEDEIEKHGKEYLSDLRGFLRHENDMEKLHEMTDFTIPMEVEDEYLSPEQEAEQEQLRAKFREETKKARYA
jgi:hypothetical protein